MRVQRYSPIALQIYLHKKGKIVNFEGKILLVFNKHVFNLNHIFLASSYLSSCYSIDSSSSTITFYTLQKISEKKCNTLCMNRRKDTVHEEHNKNVNVSNEGASCVGKLAAFARNVKVLIVFFRWL